ncbi:hypothetical protein ACMHYB_45525 [Sorangium sp. So ce1128]
MRDAAALRMIDRIPRLGWVGAPSPVAALPRLASALGLDFLGVKRDDLCEPVHGGMKMRKLDYVLAAPPRCRPRRRGPRRAASARATSRRSPSRRSGSGGGCTRTCSGPTRPGA